MTAKVLPFVTKEVRETRGRYRSFALWMLRQRELNRQRKTVEAALQARASSRDAEDSSGSHD